MLESILQSLGFSQKESKVYLVCLELGSPTLSVIARRVQENRVTVYSTLQKMIKGGYASSITKNKVLYFSVISPEQLLQQHDQRVQAFRQKLPEFLALEQAFGGKPRVEFFEGISGLENVYQDILVEGKPMFVFRGIALFHKQFQKFIDTVFIPQRVKQKIKVSVITSKKDKFFEYIKTDKKLLRETKVITDPVFELTGEIILYGDKKIGIVMQDEMMAMIIHSEGLYRNLKSIFELMWKRL